MPKETKVDLSQFRQALELPETATAEDILAHMIKMKEPVETGEIVQLRKQVDAQSITIQGLQHLDRVSQYRAFTNTLTAIQGKPEELAEKLATIEEKHGKPEADEMVKNYQTLQASAQAINLLAPIGTARSGVAGAKDDFEEEMEAYAVTKGVTKDDPMGWGKVLAHFAETRPRQFEVYRRNVKTTVSGS